MWHDDVRTYIGPVTLVIQSYIMQGAKGLRVVVDQLHAAGVKVMWAYNPWDQDTKGSENSARTDPLAMASPWRLA